MCHIVEWNGLMFVYEALQAKINLRVSNAQIKLLRGT